MIQALQQNIPICLPRFDFSLKIADQQEKQQILNIMLSAGRQTMNLRLMPFAKLLVLRNADQEIVGWMGVDYEYNQTFPETFSLFIHPSYRNRQLSLVLKHAVYSILLAQGIHTSYSRMEASSNQKLIQYNLASGFYRELKKSEMPVHWQGMCTQCELYGKSCQSQIYLAADVVGLLAALDLRLGKLGDRNFSHSCYIYSKHGVITYESN